MITPAFKDEILHLITDNNSEMVCGLNVHEVSEEYNVSWRVIDAILDEFERLNLITNERSLGGSIWIQIHVPAFDLVRRGGFIASEELLYQNIEKLLLEIESLKPNMPEKIANITSIASNIATALGLFVK